MNETIFNERAFDFKFMEISFGNAINRIENIVNWIQR